MEKDAAVQREVVAPYRHALGIRADEAGADVIVDAALLAIQRGRIEERRELLTEAFRLVDSRHHPRGPASLIILPALVA